MSDNRATRERLQAEALKANLRRRKAQSRAQSRAQTAAAAVVAAAPPPEPKAQGDE